ncbi:MAG: cell division protein FtsZ [Bacteroidetes bacterium]|nr:cell division protein FtsZ [Bacteroidota bacterium]
MFETGSYKFDLPKHHKSIIKVIGIGGGGSNAVNHMYKLGIKDVEFVVANTDLQALNSSPVPHKLQLGATLTEGLGCGANPEVGRAAALESKDQIREMLTGTKMIFVTAGMGGGTGTGAAPVIAKIAKDMEILTVGIVTVPFGFEGKKKLSQAELGIEALRASCDTVLVILNDKLREIYGNLAIGQAFGEADNVLTTAAKGIAEIITLAGYVNVDFQDVRTVMLNAGAAVMGSAETRGDNRAVKAAQQALASPLLDNRDIMGAKKILLSIISGEEAELQMDELTTITEYIQQQAGDEAEVIFGHGVDSTLGDRIRVTVIATGFFQEGKMSRKTSEKKVHELDRSQISLFGPVDNSVNQRIHEIELRIKEGDGPILNDKDNSSVEKPSVEKPSVQKPVDKPVLNTPEEIEHPVEERTYVFQNPSIKEEEGEESLFADDDEFKTGNEIAADQIMNEEGLMEVRKTKERLEQQAKERREKLKSNRKQEMTKEEFNEKWVLPAYLRRGVKVDDNVHHSSEPFISRYNLNDDNNLLGNNKFLHDNVD